MKTIFWPIFSFASILNLHALARRPHNLFSRSIFLSFLNSIDHCHSSVGLGLFCFVELLFRIALKVACHMQLQMYPLDRQKCDLVIESCELTLIFPHCFCNPFIIVMDHYHSCGWTFFRGHLQLYLFLFLCWYSIIGGSYGSLSGTLWTPGRSKALLSQKQSVLYVL